MTQSENPPLRRLYRARDESVWAMIRQRYLSGETQKTLALAYDVPVCTIQKRITREGWSKRAAIGIRPTFGGMAAPRAFELIPPQARWPEAYEAASLGAAPSESGGEPFSRKNPPEDFRGGPRPLPGLPHRPTHVWTPPPGYGPMPPHLVPPVQRPLSDDGAPPVSPSPVTPGDVADQAVAAAGRAISEGRYAEAERLGKLAESMRRQAGVGTASRPRLAEPDEEDADEDQTPAGDRLLNCTLKTCALHAIHQQARAVGQRVMNLARAPEQEDLAAWADMAEAMGGVRDPELAAVLAAYRAEGMAGIAPHLTAVLGPQADAPPVTFPEVFRGR